MTILSLAFQTLIISISSYLLWFWLLRHYLTSRLMLLSLFIPLFGVLFGAALLRDPVGSRFAVGALLVLTGVLTGISGSFCAADVQISPRRDRGSVKDSTLREARGVRRRADIGHTDIRSAGW